jgi:DNA-binding GntR family transcriptional regulator
MNGNQRGDRVEFVASRLREQIADGELKPGAPIRQAAVAKQLGTSRIPVREALHRLESEGLVVLRPNSGARVAVLDFAECLEIYKTRERLEPLAIRESIELLTEEQHQAIIELEARLADPGIDHNEWLAGDRELHLACYGGIRDSRLIETIVGYWNSTQHYRRALLQTFTDDDLQIVNAEHLLIVNTVVTRKARAAEELIRIHVERSRLRLADHRELFET